MSKLCSKHISLRIPIRLLDLIESESKNQNLTVSGFIRRAVLEKLKENEKYVPVIEKYMQAEKLQDEVELLEGKLKELQADLEGKLREIVIIDERKSRKNYKASNGSKRIVQITEESRSRCRGKKVPSNVISEIRRLAAEGLSLNAIKASLEERGVEVGRSTICQYRKEEAKLNVFGVGQHGST